MRVRLTLLAAMLVLGSNLSAQMMKAADAGDKGVDAAANDPVLDEAAQQIGRALFLRCMCWGDTLAYNAQGRLADGTKTKPVDWTLAGVDVQKVSRKSPEEVELDGVRVAMRWDDNAKQFQRKDIKAEPVHITVAGVSDRAGFRAALNKFAAVGIDHALQMAMPPYWQHYFLPRTPWPNEPELGAAPIPQAGVKRADGTEIAVPPVSKKAEAEYTLEASRDRVAGPVVLQVTVDAAGKPHRVAVVQPLGYGLDATAVHAAEKTVFAAPTVNGKASPVLLLVRQEFVFQQVPQP